MGKYNKESKKEYYLVNREDILNKARNRSKTNKAKKKEYNIEYRIKNREKLLLKDKEKYIKNKDKNKDRLLRKCFGISLDDYLLMFNNQNGLCKICNKPETAKQVNSEAVRMLAVDHDHDTGKIRSLLCSRCNLALGQFNDDIVILESAIEYLKYHGKKGNK